MSKRSEKPKKRRSNEREVKLKYSTEKVDMPPLVWATIHGVGEFIPIEELTIVVPNKKARHRKGKSDE